MLLCVPLLLLWVFCAVVTDSPKTKTLLGKTEAAVTRPCNKPNIQKFRFRSLRGHVFPFCLFSFFLVSPGRSEGSSGLTSLWRHIASRPKPLVVVLFLSPFQITQNKAELLYIIAALHITLHCFFTIDFLSHYFSYSSFLHMKPDSSCVTVSVYLSIYKCSWCLFAFNKHLKQEQVGSVLLFALSWCLAAGQCT